VNGHAGSEERENRLRIGVISFAHMHAHSYARAVCALPDVVLVGVADDNESRAERRPGNTASPTSAMLGSCWNRDWTLSSSALRMCATGIT